LLLTAAFARAIDVSVKQRRKHHAIQNARRRAFDDSAFVAARRQSSRAMVAPASRGMMSGSAAPCALHPRSVRVARATSVLDHEPLHLHAVESRPESTVAATGQATRSQG
jgi:hypothetical protein